MSNELIVTTPSTIALNFDRLAKDDRTLSLQEGRAVVAALDADQDNAGMNDGKSAAKLIMGSYPKADVHDPKTFVTAVTLVLSEYPIGVLRRVSDPRTGIAGRLKFLPTVAEIKNACDAEMKLRHQIRCRVGLRLYHDRIDRNGSTDGWQDVVRECLASVGVYDNGDAVMWSLGDPPPKPI
jgi:hypothetical protein